MGDLKQQNQQRQQGQPLQQTMSAPPTAAAFSKPVDSGMLPEESSSTKSPTLPDSAPTVAEGGGGWLSFVLAPFLTDSDMREIHADSYIDDTLTSGRKLVST